MTDNKYDKFLEKVIPASMTIAMFKLQLAEKLNEKVNEIAANQGIKLYKNDKEDIENVILDVVATIPPSFFKIPLGFKPNSESEVKKALNEFDEESVNKIMNRVINELKRHQTKISKYI